MIETDRLVAADTGDNREEVMDRAIRPRRLDEYIGQRAVREQMEIFLSAARGRGEPLDHTLIFGPPGLGKTTLASIIADEMGVSAEDHFRAGTGKSWRYRCIDDQFRARRRPVH